MTFKNTGSFRGGGSRSKQRLTLFDDRRAKPVGIRYQDIDDLILRAAIGTAATSGVTLSFAPAAGGAGIMLKIWQGDGQAAEFCDSAEALNELLLIIIEKFGSSAEDWRQFYGRAAELPTAAD